MRRMITVWTDHAKLDLKQRAMHYFTMPLFTWCLIYVETINLLLGPAPIVKLRLGDPSLARIQ